MTVFTGCIESIDVRNPRFTKVKEHTLPTHRISNQKMSHNKSQSATARNKARLMQLLQDPANKHCADCKTARNPRWASWNLGLFICIRCSGIHRSLGTHITRVKSVDLDSWTDEQTDSMCQWGNKKGNSYWEAKLKPRNQQEVELGGYIPMDGKVESFVRTKYELGKWKDEGQRDPARYVNVNVNANVKPASTQTSTPSSTSKATDSLDSLLDFGPPKSTPVVLSSSTSSLPDGSATVNRRTNPTITLLEQHSGPSVLQKQQQQSQQPSQQQPQSQRNNRPDLKKSILSLYSTPSPSASYSNISSSASINHSGSSNSTTTSTFTTLQAQSQSPSNATGGNGIWSSTIPSTTQTRNYVGEDPFKNVWS